MLSYTHSLFRISRGSFGKGCGVSSNHVFKKAFAKNQVYLKISVPRMQIRASSFDRKNVTGGKSLLSQTVPVKKESAITLTRVAYVVKLVRFPFLLVAISSIGYQRGGKSVPELFLALTSEIFAFNKTQKYRLSHSRFIIGVFLL